MIIICSVIFYFCQHIILLFLNFIILVQNYIIINLWFELKVENWKYIIILYFILKT